MPSPSTLARWVGFLLFGGFFGVVFWKLANGAMPLEQLLESDAGSSEGADGNSASASSPSAGRAQSLAITLFVALYYLVQVIRDPKKFPEIPNMLVALLAGSQAIYLGGKALDMIPDSWRDFLK